MSSEDWRVEIDLDDKAEGFDVFERLRSLNVDDQARERLGSKIYVSRNGSTLFLYAATEEQAREAQAVMHELVAAYELTADFHGVTRWHPVEQEWKDASIPLPRTEDEVRAEEERREASERREAAAQGSTDWVVKINLPAADHAKGVQQRLEADGYPVDRIWRWVTVYVLTEQIGNELVSSLQRDLPEGTEVWLEANVDDPDSRELPFVLADPRMY